MNTQPNELPPCPDGFEYFGLGPLTVKSNWSSGDDVAILEDGCEKWEIGAIGDSDGCHYALRINSPIHAANFPAKVEGLPDGLPTPPDAPNGMRWAYRGTYWGRLGEVDYAYFSTVGREWTTHNCEPCGNSGHYLEAVPITHPEKSEAKVAREFWIKKRIDSRLDKCGSFEHGYIYPEKAQVYADELEVIKVREILPNEPDLLAMAVFLLRNAEQFSPDISEFLSGHFPESTPAFDWDQLWAAYPWVGAWTCGYDGRWIGHEREPEFVNSWISAGGQIMPPSSMQPPTAPDWKQSLIQRPTLSQTKP